MSQSTRPVAIVNDGSFYVGPPLARALAVSGFDLVVGDPAEGLAAELEALGATVISVPKVRDITRPENAEKLTQEALHAFGRIDSAVMFSGLIVTGSILKSSREDLDKVYNGCVVAPYEFLKAVLPTMVSQQSGQVLLITSASAARPTPGAPLYSSMRAAATLLAKN